MFIVADIRTILMSSLWTMRHLRIPRRKSVCMCRSWTSSITMTLYMDKCGSLVICRSNKPEENIWAASWQNQQNAMCTQWRLRSAWASTQSDQSSLSALRKPGSLTTHWVHSKDSDQTGRMPRLIWVFTGHIYESSLGAQFCWFCHEVAHYDQAIRNFMTWHCAVSESSDLHAQAIDNGQLYVALCLSFLLFHMSLLMTEPVFEDVWPTCSATENS